MQAPYEVRMSFMPKQFPPKVREQAVRLMRDHVAD